MYHTNILPVSCCSIFHVLSQIYLLDTMHIVFLEGNQYPADNGPICCRPTSRGSSGNNMNNNGGLQVGIADDQAKDFDFEKTEMKYDSTGMFHWGPAKSLEECILVSWWCEESCLMPAKSGIVCVISNFEIIMIIFLCGAFDRSITAKITGLKPTKNLLSDQLFENMLSYLDC